jgi:hypothetical protein
VSVRVSVSVKWKLMKGWLQTRLHLRDLTVQVQTCFSEGCIIEAVCHASVRPKHVSEHNSNTTSAISRYLVFSGTIELSKHD